MFSLSNLIRTEVISITQMRSGSYWSLGDSQEMYMALGLKAGAYDLNPLPLSTVFLGGRKLWG